jgi:hypothetical protein
MERINHGSTPPAARKMQTVARVFEVFGKQKKDLWLFEEQFARWKMDKLSVIQRASLWPRASD